MSEKTSVWFEVQISLRGHDVDVAAELLHQIGCAGVVSQDTTLDAFEPPADLVPETLVLKAYFENPGSAEALTARVLEALAPLQQGDPGAIGPIACTAVEPMDWADGWKQNFPILPIGSRLLIVPTWEEVPEATTAEVIRLDPGMAFGTGTHETTALCLQALVDCPLLPGRTVLDVGTGSGILGIAAARLGAQRVVGTDIDPVACDVARENVALNAVADRFQVVDTPLQQIPGSFAVVIANILAEENARLAEPLTEHVAAGGWLILSGILQEKEGLVAAAFAKTGLTDPDIRHLGEWSCMVYRRQ